MVGYQEEAGTSPSDPPLFHLLVGHHVWLREEAVKFDEKEGRAQKQGYQSWVGKVLDNLAESHALDNAVNKN